MIWRPFSFRISLDIIKTDIGKYTVPLRELWKYCLSLSFNLHCTAIIWILYLFADYIPPLSFFQIHFNILCLLPMFWNFIHITLKVKEMFWMHINILFFTSVGVHRWFLPELIITRMTRKWWFSILIILVILMTGNPTVTKTFCFTCMYGLSI